MTLADAEVNLGIAGGLVLLALIVFVWWFGRDRRYRRIRFGIFLERERFRGDPDEKPPESRPGGWYEPPADPDDE